MSARKAREDYARSVRQQAQRLAQQRFGCLANPCQLQAIVFAVTCKLYTFEKAGPDWQPHELAEVRVRIARALARERGKARAGHRSYDFNRHIALHQALRSLERMADEARQMGRTKQKTGPKGPAL